MRIEKARKCIQAAEALIKIDAYADAASRSYYSIFHTIQAVLTTVGFSSKKHSGSISDFRRCFVKTGVFPPLYSDIVGDAFTVRNRSDYDIHYVVVRAEVVKQLENAKTFLAAVEDYIKTL